MSRRQLAMFATPLLVLGMFFELLTNNALAATLYSQPSGPSSVATPAQVSFAPTSNGLINHIRLFLTSPAPSDEYGWMSLTCSEENFSSCSSSDWSDPTDTSPANIASVNNPSYSDPTLVRTGDTAIDFYWPVGAARITNHSDYGYTSGSSNSEVVYSPQALICANENVTSCTGNIPTSGWGMNYNGRGSDHLLGGPFIYQMQVDGELPSNYYAQIKNSSGGEAFVYDASSTSANKIKALPEDWIIHVSTTTDSSDSPITDGSYNWYQVIDPTDGAQGWMQGSDAAETTPYLSYDPGMQAAFIASSSNEISTTTDRANEVLQAIDHYYNNSSTNDSLYSSDDSSDDISFLKTATNPFPEKVIFGIAARESGGVNFDNEDVTYDYGHGVMQITPTGVFAHEATNDWASNSDDNRGFASGIKIYPCTSNASNLYQNCYTNAGTHDSVDTKSYQPYGGTPGNQEYKYYTNTPQSIYANVKDGLETLSEKFNRPYIQDIATSTTVGTTTYSAADRQTILATEAYNGNDCGYVGAVAGTLANISDYFASATSSDITGLIEEMDQAGSDAVCANLHSPATITVQDSEGHSVGIENGQEFNNFPLAVNDPTEKFVKILAASSTEDYTFRVVGTANATYGLDIQEVSNGKTVAFHATSIPTIVGEAHIYHINKAALAAGQNNAVTIQVQPPRSSSYETISAGPTLSGSEFKLSVQSADQALSASS